jgi:hypothetical protein
MAKRGRKEGEGRKVHRKGCRVICRVSNGRKRKEETNAIIAYEQTDRRGRAGVRQERKRDGGERGELKSRSRQERRRGGGGGGELKARPGGREGKPSGEVALTLCLTCRCRRTSGA